MAKRKIKAPKKLVWKNRIFTCEVTGDKILHAYTNDSQINTKGAKALGLFLNDE